MQLLLAVLLGVIARPIIASAQNENGIQELVAPVRAAIAVSDFKRFLLISKEVITVFRGKYPSTEVRQKSLHKALIEALKELNLLLNSGAFKELSLEQQRRVIGEFFGAPEDQTLPKVRRIRVFEIHQGLDGMDDFYELAERYRRVNAKSKAASVALNQAYSYISDQKIDLPSFVSSVELLPVQDLSLKDLGSLQSTVKTGKVLSSRYGSGRDRTGIGEVWVLKNRLEATLQRIRHQECIRIPEHS